MIYFEAICDIIGSIGGIIGILSYIAIYRKDKQIRQEENEMCHLRIETGLP